MKKKLYIQPEVSIEFIIEDTEMLAGSPHTGRQPAAPDSGVKLDEFGNVIEDNGDDMNGDD